MKPVHYDIQIIPGQRYDDEFIYPADLTNYLVEFWLSDRVSQSTLNDTLSVKVNVPSTGHTTICPVFTTDETRIMTVPIKYELRITDEEGVQDLPCYGKITPMEE